jgi:hypothetical protein
MIRFRAHDWFNTLTQSPAYGIQAKEDRGPWMHVRKGEKPLIFETAAERDVELGKLQQRAEQHEEASKRADPNEVPAPGPSR